jgi:hypothetical protein
MNYDAAFDAAGREFNVDPRLIKTVFFLESGGNPNTQDSEAGAQGGMQIMPDTAKYLGISDPRDMSQAIPAAARYLAEGLDATGSPNGALAYYFAGPDRSGWGPKTAAYIRKGASLYPQMALNMTANTASDVAPSYAPSAPSSAPLSGADIVARFAAQQPATAPHATGGSLPDVLATLRQEQSGNASPASSRASEAAPQTGADIVAAFAKAQPAKPTAPAETVIGVPGAGTVSVEVPAPDNQDHSSAVTDMGLKPVVEAAKEGYENTQPLINPDSSTGQWLQAHGMGGLTMPLAPLAAGNALMRGAQEGVVQLGNALQGTAIDRGLNDLGLGGTVQLSRDIAGLPEALAGHVEVPAAAEARSAAASANKLARAPAPPVPALLTDDFKASPVAAGTPAANKLTMPQPAAAPANRLAPETSPASAGSAAVQSGPASPVPADIVPPSKTATAAVEPESVSTEAPKGTILPIRTQAQADAEADRILRHFAGNGNVQIDTTTQVPGTRPTLSQSIVGGNSGIAGLERSIRDTPGQNAVDFQKVEDANRQARSEEAQRIIGTPADIAGMEAERDAATQAAHDKVFDPDNLKPTDPAPVVEQIDKIMSGREGQRDVVKNALASIRAKLVDADGNLQTDPDLLYGVRKAINDAISPKAAGTAGDARQAAAELIRVRSALDDVIEQGAPGFKSYIDDYSVRSEPIEGMQYLQNMRLTDANGNITLAKLDNAIKSLERQRQAPGANAASSVTDEQLASLKTLRDDFRRDQKQQTGKAIGSNTVQNLGTNRLMDVLGHPLVSTVTNTGAAAATLSHPYIGLPLAYLKSRLEGAGAKGQEMVMQSLRRKLLNPDEARSAFQQPPASGR